MLGVKVSLFTPHRLEQVLTGDDLKAQKKKKKNIYTAAFISYGFKEHLVMGDIKSHWNSDFTPSVENHCARLDSHSQYMQTSKLKS